MNVDFKFSLGETVVDETRDGMTGKVYRLEFEKRGIFYAIEGRDTKWLAKEGALTAKKDYKPQTYDTGGVA